MSPYNVFANPYEQVARLEERVADQAAELAAMRPWAEVGKRAVRERWYRGGDKIRIDCFWCGATELWRETHDPDCPIPDLIARLEADNAAATD